jgi:hypothetical protein
MMTRLLTALAFTVAIGCSFVAHAEVLPGYVLDKEFEACMGGTTMQQDPQRGQYCDCVRDSMRTMDVDSYAQAATEQSKAADPSKPTAKIQAIAEACLNKVLK